MSGASRSSRRRSFGALAAFALIAGCSPVPQTEIVVVVSSDLPRGTALQSVRVIAQRSGVAAPMLDTTYGLTDTRYPLPGEVTLVARDPDDARPVTVRIIGQVGGQPLQQESVVRFRRERTLYLQMTLSSMCVGRECGTGQTCRLGGCVTPEQIQPTESRPSVLQPGDAAVGSDLGADVASEDRPDAQAEDVVDGGMGLDVATDATDVPGMDAPDAPSTDVPTVDTPDVPAVDTPDVPAVDTPDVPAVDTPDVPAVDTPDVLDVPAADLVDVPSATDAATDLGAPDACPTAFTLCAGGCVDTSSSPSHCGACGRSCGTGTLCTLGVCTLNRQRSCAAGVPGCGEVIVPGGTFTMGEGSPALAASPVQPGTTVGTFAIDTYEVTVARFRRWVAAGRPVPSAPVMYPAGPLPFEGTVNTEAEFNCGSESSYPNYPRTDRENHPMNCVNWATAQAFCVWDGGRLPTQAEWEFAARGTSGRSYPWGAAPPDDTRVCWSGSGAMRPSTCPVGMFDTGAVDGIHDLAGNVWEWNADWMAPYETGGAGCWRGAPSTDALCSDRASGGRVFRGGSWFNSDASGFRAATREAFAPVSRNWNIGFRCVRPAPLPPIATQRSCATSLPGCGLVEVAGGTFSMGGDVDCATTPGDPSCLQYGSPRLPSISVGAFAIDAYEVTVARFNAFWSVRARDIAAVRSTPVVYPGGQTISLNPTAAEVPFSQAMNSDFNWSPSSTNRDAHPMNGINWWAAQEFCVWDGGRLPTDAEWEFVARGRAAAGLTPGRAYPWGDAPPSECDRAQWSGCSTIEDGARNLRVGHFAGVAGVFDLAGNVAEWTADWFQQYNDPSCWGATPRTNPLCLVQGTGSKAFRGGSYESSVVELRSASRNGNGSIVQYPSVGFRCARTR